MAISIQIVEVTVVKDFKWVSSALKVRHFANEKRKFARQQHSHQRETLEWPKVGSNLFATAQLSAAA